MKKALHLLQRMSGKTMESLTFWLIMLPSLSKEVIQPHLLNKPIKLFNQTFSEHSKFAKLSFLFSNKLKLLD